VVSGWWLVASEKRLVVAGVEWRVIGADQGRSSKAVPVKLLVTLRDIALSAAALTRGAQGELLAVFLYDNVASQRFARSRPRDKLPS
jgi:hypothetical protein